MWCVRNNKGCSRGAETLPNLRVELSGVVEDEALAVEVGAASLVEDFCSTEVACARYCSSSPRICCNMESRSTCI